jgi:hypothetical protein
MKKPLPLRKKLAEEYNVSERTMRRRIADRWNEGGCTFSRRVAALSLAADKGINPALYAAEEELEELRKLQSMLKTKPPPAPKAIVARKREKTAKVYELKLKKGLGNVPLNLTPAEMKNAEIMTDVYYHLYILENSLRQFILDVMSDNSGKDWWNEARIRKSTREKASSRREKEELNRWLDGSRGMHPIFYVDFEDYKAILMRHWSFFEPYFAQIDSPQSWVLTTLGEIALSRHNVAHMGFLGNDIRQKVLLNLRAWLRQIAVEK